MQGSRKEGSSIGQPDGVVQHGLLTAELCFPQRGVPAWLKAAAVSGRIWYATAPASDKQVAECGAASSRKCMQASQLFFSIALTPPPRAPPPPHTHTHTHTHKEIPACLHPFVPSWAARGAWPGFCQESLVLPGMPCGFCRGRESSAWEIGKRYWPSSGGLSPCSCPFW